MNPEMCWYETEKEALAVVSGTTDQTVHSQWLEPGESDTKDSFNVSRSFTNNSEFHLVVGDCNTIISSHETGEEALEALQEINIGDSAFSSISVVGPKETTAGDFSGEVPLPDDYYNLYKGWG